jgi:alpha-tubulin suppressor-like RCC1 family protein
MAVATGCSFTVAVGEDGGIFSFGSNLNGQLGTNDMGLWAEDRLDPTRVAGLPAPVRQVATGGYHTAMVTEVGDLLMCGRGMYGRLGLGDERDRATPTLVARAVFDGEAVLMVACGDAHTAVATEGGGVYTFGNGEVGQLGHGDEENQLAPRRVPAAAFNDERIVMVAAGGSHTVALSEAGHVFTWGDGGVGQLGHNDRERQRAPRQVEAGRFGSDKVVFVAAGGGYTVAVTAGGRLYTWGFGNLGRLGHGDAGDRLVPTLVGAGAFGAPEGGRVVMAACGMAHTLVVTQDGALWVCGRGYDGQLGLSDLASRHSFERVGAGAFGGARVVAAAAGDLHSAAVTEDGALWTWGSGYHGRLGHGNRKRCFVPMRVSEATRIGRCRPLPEDHALALFMSTHPRLGARVPVASCDGDLISMIAVAAGSWVRGKAAESEGLIRLIGGVSADRRLRYKQMLNPDFSQRGRADKLVCKMCMVQPQNPEQSSSI